MANALTFSDLLDLAKNRTQVTLNLEHGLAIAHVATLISRVRPVVLTAPDNEIAQAWARDVRFLLGDDQNVLLLEGPERTPYHATSPDPLAVMERLATLQKLAQGQSFSVLIASAEALLMRSLPLSAIQDHTHQLEKGALVDREALIASLNTCGYSRVTQVEDPGTYAVRGSIVDIFWPGQKAPFRIDLFGDVIENIFSFNPTNQRIISKETSFQFGLVRDIPLTPKSVQLAEQKLRDLADEVEYPTKKLSEKIADINNLIPFFGIENLMPAFFETLQSPLEIIQGAYGSEVSLIFGHTTSPEQTAKSLNKEFDEHYASALVRGELCFSPAHFLVSSDAIQKQTEPFHRLNLVGFDTHNAHRLESATTQALRQEILRKTTQEGHFLEPLEQLLQRLRREGLPVFLPQSSPGDVHRLKEMLSAYPLNIRQLASPPNLLDFDAISATKDPSVHAYVYVAKPEAPTEGGILNYFGCAVVSEDDIFGKKSRRTKARKQKGFKTTLSDLNAGDAIVHVDHGIGVFKGLTKLNVRGVEQDYLLLSYADDDKLYLPVHRINLIQAYSGAEGKMPRLDKLGGPGWQSKKKKVKAAVMAMAQDLLQLYAKRELARRPKVAPPAELYWTFEAGFAFETTPDQQKAIDDVIADMQKDRPMDRLICGDVGYGKTEVAMRAAMLAVESGKQVAVLAPTTVLAQQHGITFSERFKSTGVTSKVISRFQKPAEIKETLLKAKEHKVDIVIGTHRLLSSDVSFKNLGLIVVDEEQRFGIKDKERLKKMRAQVDVLTMSATPIPRTLQMGFFGIRDLSIIETPPMDRRAIRTSVNRFDDAMIREAMLRELGRGGQIYFVHNKVSSINATADYLRRLVPEAKIEVGHGQMDETQLEDVMVRFMRHEFNVLVCTTIIETGIDVPSANTLFVDNADDFGLAQLYQLRGRVGRSKERAFAYLLVPGDTDQLTPVARKRLEILNRFSELGAGFKIAQHDLELRGAGDLLGKSQHGHVAAVGYDLYVDLLKEAVEDLRGKDHQEVFDPEVNLPLAALIPDDYVADLHERMGLYQRFGAADNEAEVLDVLGLVADEYGQVPEAVHGLADVMILKHHLRAIRARGLDVVHDGQATSLPRVVVSLGEAAHLDPAKLTAWIKANNQQASLSPKMKLTYTPTLQEWQQGANQKIVGLCRQVLKMLGEMRP